MRFPKAPPPTSKTASPPRPGKTARSALALPPRYNAEIIRPNRANSLFGLAPRSNDTSSQARRAVARLGANCAPRRSIDCRSFGREHQAVLQCGEPKSTCRRSRRRATDQCGIDDDSLREFFVGQFGERRPRERRISSNANRLRYRRRQKASRTRATYHRANSTKLGKRTIVFALPHLPDAVGRQHAEILSQAARRHVPEPGFSSPCWQRALLRSRPCLCDVAARALRMLPTVASLSQCRVPASSRYPRIV
jgi:hypothetical protein